MLTVTVLGLAAALADVVGGWFTLRFSLMRGDMEQLMGVGAGFLLGSALLTMIPAAAHRPEGPATTALGFAGFLLLRAVADRLGQARGPVGAESAWAVFTGMLLHSVIEGIALGLAVRTGGTIGWIALTALVLHKLPEGVSLASVVLSAAGSVRVAWYAVFVVGFATVVGSWGALLWSDLAALPQATVLGLAAGSFLYVGAAEMLPFVLRKGGSPWLVLAGMALVYLLTGSQSHRH